MTQDHHPQFEYAPDWPVRCVLQLEVRFVVGGDEIAIFDHGTAAFPFLKLGRSYGAKNWTADFFPLSFKNEVETRHTVRAKMFFSSSSSNSSSSTW